MPLWVFTALFNVCFTGPLSCGTCMNCLLCVLVWVFPDFEMVASLYCPDWPWPAGLKDSGTSASQVAGTTSMYQCTQLYSLHFQGIKGNNPQHLSFLNFTPVQLHSKKQRCACQWLCSCTTSQTFPVAPALVLREPGSCQHISWHTTMVVAGSSVCYPSGDGCFPPGSLRPLVPTHIW